MLNEKLELLEKSLLAEVKAFYVDCPAPFAVYDSCGRGIHSRDSDFDFLLAFDDLPSGRVCRIAELISAEKKLKPLLQSLFRKATYTVFSPILKTPAETELGSPLFFDTVEDARLLFGRCGFLCRDLSIPSSKTR